MKEDDDISHVFRDSPLYLKAMEILDVTTSIHVLVYDRIEDLHSGLTDMEKQILKSTIDDMVASAAMITTKIAGAIGADFYDLRMENATLIRMHARQLMVGVHGLSMFGYDEAEYFQVLRDDIEDLRILFVNWVKTFDPWIYVNDRWGLFNPPGVAVSDEADGLPMDREEYFHDEDE